MKTIMFSTARRYTSEQTLKVYFPYHACGADIYNFLNKSTTNLAKIQTLVHSHLLNIYVLEMKYYN
jgi:hypothetical protein